MWAELGPGAGGPANREAAGANKCAPREESNRCYAPPPLQCPEEMKEHCPFNLSFKQHEDVLSWIDSTSRLELDFAARARNVHIWALVALAALAHSSESSERKVSVRWGPNPQADFARAVGFAEIVSGQAPYQEVQRHRTVRLQRVHRFEQIEAAAADISRLVIKAADAEDTRQTLYYILVEFLRNAVQHSQDKRGAVVGAQLMDKTREYKKQPVIQVAVGDAGIGIHNSLLATYPNIADPHEALTTALQPWVSSQFYYGARGGTTNAGLGLYFISEMAKRAAGRLLVASRGGSLLLQGDETYQQHHHIKAEGPGFPGTIVVFELPLGEVQDYDSLISYIQETAKQRLPSARHIRWFTYQKAPHKALRLGVRYGAEDTARAQRLVSEHLLPRIARGESVELDFSGLQVCTQSYLHALLFTVLQAAYAAQVPLYVTNATPAVVSSLDFLEGYALTG